MPLFLLSTTMFPTNPCFSKAMRRALTPKRGNKDYYKGASGLPGRWLLQ